MKRNQLQKIKLPGISISLKCWNPSSKHKVRVYAIKHLKLYVRYKVYLNIEIDNTSFEQNNIKEKKMFSQNFNIYIYIYIYIYL